MQYRYAQDRNFEDYASGRVFYARAGQPAFPVRLASEIFQRCYQHWFAGGKRGGCTLYDPVCGGGYWLAVLAYLHWEAIAAIYASDFDRDVLPLAQRNLSLTTLEGLNQRISEIEAMIARFHKASHRNALESAREFYRQLESNLESHAIEGTVFQADATNAQNIALGLTGQQVDLILADVPYGWHSQWQIANEDKESQLTVQTAHLTPIEAMLRALHSILNPGAVLAIAYDKSQKFQQGKYLRLERFQVGKRRILILQNK